MGSYKAKSGSFCDFSGVSGYFCNIDALECEGQAEAGEDGQLVDTLEGGAVEVEDVLPAVDVGDAEVEFQDRPLAQREFAFHTQVKTMVVRQTSFVELGIVDAVVAVLAGVVADDIVAEEERLVDTLRLGEGIATAEAPTATDLPLALLAEGIGSQQVHRVATVVVGVVSLHLVHASHIAQRVGGPQIESLEVGADAYIEARGEAFLNDEVGHQILGLGIKAVAVDGVAGVVELVAVGVDELVEVFEVELAVEGDMLGEVVFGAKDGVGGPLDV